MRLWIFWRDLFYFVLDICEWKQKRSNVILCAWMCTKPMFDLGLWMVTTKYCFNCPMSLNKLYHFYNVAQILLADHLNQNGSILVTSLFKKIIWCCCTIIHLSLKNKYVKLFMIHVNVTKYNAIVLVQTLLQKINYILT